MKKFFALAALVSVALTGCVTNKQFDDAAPSEIAFQAVNKVPTKAIIEGTDFSGDFTVYGFYSQSENYDDVDEFAMYNVECTKQGTYYKNNTQSYYWPLSGGVGFYAVAPASVTPTVSWGTGLTVEHTVPGGQVDATPVDQVDLMFAYNKGNKSTSALPMVFYHALAQIVVNVRTGDALAGATYNGATLTVNSVSFKNVDNAGTCVYKESSPADANANPSITWSDNTDLTDLNYYKAATLDATENYATYGAAILAIPQAMSTADDKKSAISIEYTLTQNSTDLTGTVDMPVTTAWAVNTKHIYNINFKLNEILFNPSIDANSWVTVTTDAISIE